MPIVQIRHQSTDSNENPRTIISTYTFLVAGVVTINGFYDYIYCPIKKYINKNKNKNPNNDENILHTLNLIEDENIYYELMFCLENKDNKNENSNINSIIRKYNDVTNADTNVKDICCYLTRYLNDANGLNMEDENDIYYIDL